MSSYFSLPMIGCLMLLAFLMGCLPAVFVGWTPFWDLKFLFGILGFGGLFLASSLIWEPIVRRRSRVSF